MSEAPLYLLALPNSGRLSILNLTCWVRGTGAPRSQQNTTPQEPPVGICPGPYGGPRGGAFSDERGTPVFICRLWE